MDPYAILATRYAKSTLPSVAHSSLPGAPTQPFHPRRRRRGILAAGARRFRRTAPP
jgi:hypothetical protein